ncbi:MAG: hypothetical protein L0Y71_19990 [Gemmataceae bacterium]|nr:hypothetical protein [Gemmataceae bacterium]
MNIKLIDITQINGPIDIPEPRDLTPEEEAAIIARYKAERDPEQMEAEYKELLEQFHRGELVDATELLREIRAGTPARKPS